MIDYRFIEPLDVLYLRGNKLFEGAGAHGAAQMPPWPSLAAGALRSRMLADAGVDLAAYARGESRPTDPRLAEVLGTPAEPGDFRITVFTLAQRVNNAIEPCFPLPADVVVTDNDGLGDAGYLAPTVLHPALRSSAGLPQLPLRRAAQPAKRAGGLWLNADGWRAYLSGERLTGRQLLRSADLWQTDPRLGIALDGGLGTVQPGLLYTAETVAFARAGRDPNTGETRCAAGLLVGVRGADGTTPADGLLRLGGDGRGALVSACAPDLPEPDWTRIADERRFRLVLATPGIFAEGWRLPGLRPDNVWQGPEGSAARLVAAAVHRADVISGWDLAKWSQKKGGPKSAQRVAPAGSVYWFEDFEGSVAMLRKLAAEGFWAISDYPDRTRRAEGFNNVLIAAWPQP